MSGQGGCAWPEDPGPWPVLRLRRARGAWQRLRGLLGGPPLAADEGLWLRPCRAVHTIGMRQCLDLAFVDGRGRVVRLVHGLRPWRIACCLRARSVVELPAGAAAPARGGVARIEQALARALSDPAGSPQRRARTR